MLNIVYQTCVQPTIDYCTTLWDYSPAALMSKVQSFQNRARIVTGNRVWCVRRLSLIKHLHVGWVDVMERRDYFTDMLMHRCVYGNAPNYPLGLLYLISNIHSVPRKSNTNGDFYVSHPNLEIYKQSFYITAQ